MSADLYSETNYPSTHFIRKRVPDSVTVKSMVAADTDYPGVIAELKASGLTQEQIAEAVGASQTSVNNWLNIGQVPRYDTWKKVLELRRERLNLPPEPPAIPDELRIAIEALNALLPRQK